MKKFASALLAGVMALSLGACSSSGSGTAASGSSSASSSSASASSSTSDMKVAMITDSGDITDKSFNQTTYEASKEFSDGKGIDFNYYKPASDTDADREASIEQAIEDGYNVIVMPGYLFGTAIYDEAPSYPDVKFVAIDVAEGDLTNYGAREFSADNVYCAVYHEELAGYMAGYAAVKLGYKKLGYLGGQAVPAVVRYGSGFVQGADDAAGELGLSDVEVNYVYGGKFFGDDSITARMETWYQGGTEVVFAAGGSIYVSAAEAAKANNGKVIGVDVDQAPTIDGDYGEGITVTSAMKGLAATVNTVLGAIYDGNWSDYAGKYDNLGIVSDDPEENYVQLPEDSTQWSDSFTLDDYKALVAKLNAGEIEVDNTSDSDFIPSVDNITVNNEGSMG